MRVLTAILCGTAATAFLAACSGGNSQPAVAPNAQTPFVDIAAVTAPNGNETIVSDGTATVWDGVSPINGFVLALVGNDSTIGPQLVNYPADCSGQGLKLNQTRGVIWVYGAPAHSMYNHARPPNDPGVDCRGGLPHSSDTNAAWNMLSHNVAARSRHPSGVHALACGDEDAQHLAGHGRIGGLVLHGSGRARIA